MSGGKHTQAPWYLRLSDNATPLIEFGPVWEKGNLDYLICAMPAEIMQSFNSYANARLIAASPDMLVALEDLCAAYAACNGKDHPAYKQARAAIAKAEGGAA